MKNINLKSLFYTENKNTDELKNRKFYTIVLCDWKRLILGFAFVLIILSLFAWKIYLSNQIGGGFLKIPKDYPNAAVRTIDLKKIENTVDILKQRESDFLKIKSERTKLSDPGR